MGRIDSFHRLLAKIGSLTDVGVSVVERRYHSEQTLRGSASQGVSVVDIAVDVETRKILFLFINITDVGAGPGTLAIDIEYQSPFTDGLVTVKAIAALNSTGLRMLAIGLGLTQADAAPVFFLNLPVPANSRINVEATVATNAVTWSLDSIELENG